MAVNSFYPTIILIFTLVSPNWTLDPLLCAHAKKVDCITKNKIKMFFTVLSFLVVCRIFYTNIINTTVRDVNFIYKHHLQLVLCSHRPSRTAPLYPNRAALTVSVPYGRDGEAGLG